MPTWKLFVNRVSDGLLSLLTGCMNLMCVQFISDYASNLLSQDVVRDELWEISKKLLASFEPLECFQTVVVFISSFSREMTSSLYQQVLVGSCASTKNFSRAGQIFWCYLNSFQSNYTVCSGFGSIYRAWKGCCRWVLQLPCQSEDDEPNCPLKRMKTFWDFYASYICAH